MIKAVDAIYLDALQISNMDMIHESLSKIMDNLIKNYGHETLEDMHDTEQDFIAIHYDLISSVDAVFSVVNKFCNLCILMEQPNSNNQLTDISFIIFNKPRYFTDALKDWNKKTMGKPIQPFKTT